MESQHQKWVNLSYLALAALVGYVFFSISLKLIGTYDLEARFRNSEVLARVLSVVVGGIIFGILFRHQRANQFMNEVMVELSRVSWPAQKETSSATLVVIIMVIISGIVLGFLDYLWTMALKWVV